MLEGLTYTVSDVVELLGLPRSKTYVLVATGAVAVLAIPGRRKLVARATLACPVDEPLRTNASPPGTDHHPDDQHSSTFHDQTYPSRHHYQRSHPNRVIPFTQMHQGCPGGPTRPGAVIPCCRSGSCASTRRRTTSSWSSRHRPSTTPNEARSPAAGSGQASTASAWSVRWRETTCGPSCGS